MTAAAGRSSKLAVALAQLPCRVGDLAGNVDRILNALKSCPPDIDILVTPELSLCGYPPEDLLGYSDFLVGCESAAADLRARAGRIAPGAHIVFGLPARSGGALFNMLRVVCAGREVADARKIMLPNYGVFDEMRYFAPGEEPAVFEIKGERVGLAVCHDLWHSSFVKLLAERGPQLVCAANASPFYLDKQLEREQVVERAASGIGCDIAYVNFAGAQDEHVYDGGSHYRAGELLLRMDDEPGLATTQQPPPPLAQLRPGAQQLRRALAAGVRSYVAAGGGPVLFGLSGGIDSAVTACVAVDAVGADKAVGVLMPSRHTAQISCEDARELAGNLGIRLLEIGIEPAFGALLDSLQEALGVELAGVAVENLQSRIRGMMLMALANHHRGMVLTTGNKSEMATGFATIYGDMAGAYAVLKDVSKLRVYALADEFNRAGSIIPERIIKRPPTAELRADQLDSDTLPSYSIIDELLAEIVEGLASPRELADRVGAGTVGDFMRRLRSSEFKRRQAPIGPTVTKRAFGKDWRMPVSNAYSFDVGEAGGEDGQADEAAG